MNLTYTFKCIVSFRGRDVERLRADMFREVLKTGVCQRSGTTNGGELPGAATRESAKTRGLLEAGACWRAVRGLLEPGACWWAGLQEFEDCYIAGAARRPGSAKG
ncbi:hypothetical protein J6590_016728 [Homalodisca vitripennis]|nr:hypothetical protein J6590_016728 [Homalodisca vitripennis]